MPRCYYFNLVETPTFVTTAYLCETFCENPKCGIPEKNYNDLNLRKMIMDFVWSHFSWLAAIFQHLRPRSGSRADQHSTSVSFINKIWKIQISKNLDFDWSKGKRPLIHCYIILCLSTAFSNRTRPSLVKQFRTSLPNKCSIASS